MTYRFHGAVIHPTGGRVPVSTENLLLRGCLLKNTDFVEGIVVYAGHETKAMLNNDGPRYKVINIHLIFISFLLKFETYMIDLMNNFSSAPDLRDK